jgi:glycine/D-amino acid oxidase-like deaminating enzyme
MGFLQMVNMKCDILVIGAGVLGLSSAYYMKKRNPERNIIVIDKYSGPGQGNSAKSEGGFRNIFKSNTNFLLADSTIDFFEHLEEKGYDLKMEKIGYLWLFSEEQYRKIENALDTLKAKGFEIIEYSSEQLKEMIPDLVTSFQDDEEADLLDLENIHIGVYGKKCGVLDADALVRAYEQEFLKLGGEVKYNTETKELILNPDEELGIPGEPFVWQKSSIIGAVINKGEILAEKTVVASGVWSEELLHPVGIDSFMRPKKRQIFAFKDPKLDGLLNIEGFNHENVLPLTILPKANILFRPELSEGSLWLACADNLGRKFELEDDPEAEEGFYTNNIYHVLVKYFPCFEDVRPMNMWAGQYAINSLDETPIITAFPGLLYIGAASGSGIMKSDSLARVLDSLEAGENEAELFGGKRFRVADLGIKNRNVEHEEFVI